MFADRSGITSQVFFKIACACAGSCNRGTVSMGVEQEDGVYSLHFYVDTYLTVWDSYHNIRLVEMIKILWKRLAIAAKIVYTGEVRYSNETIIDKANIDDLFDAISEARDIIKNN